jgi:hypothetical protein
MSLFIPCVFPNFNNETYIYCDDYDCDDYDCDDDDDDCDYGVSDYELKIAINEDAYRGFRFFWNNIHKENHDTADIYDEQAFEADIMPNILRIY